MSDLAGGIGSSIGSVLEMLGIVGGQRRGAAKEAAQKERTLGGLEGLLGEEQAQSVASLDPSMRKDVLLQFLKQKGEEDFLAPFLSRGLGPEEALAAVEQIGPGGEEFGFAEEGPAQGGAGAGLMALMKRDGREDRPVQKRLERMEDRAQREGGLQGLTDREIGGLSLKKPQAAAILQRQKAQKEKVSESRRKEAFAETKDYRTEVRKDAKSATNELHILGRQQQLVDKGNLTPAAGVKLLDKIGLPLSVVSNPDSIEFEKLENEHILGIQEATGTGRITNALMGLFMKRVPSMWQTDAGKRRVIRNMSILSKMKLAKNDAMREILKENNQVPPLNLEELVEERAGKELDKLAEEFRRGAEGDTDTVQIQKPDGSQVSVERSKWDQHQKAATKKGWSLVG